MPESDADIPELDKARSIRGEYERLGPSAYYLLHGHAYRNPHEPIVQRALNLAAERWSPNLAHVLDLAAGSGEVTQALRALGAARIDGVDPFTYEAYRQRTGSPAERFSFEAIAAGALAGRRYSLAVCSFAMHLCDESRLPGLATQLALIAPTLWIVTPHKRPRLASTWGWELQGEFLVERVRVRAYRATT
jgi:hypothetical protein